MEETKRKYTTSTTVSDFAKVEIPFDGDVASYKNIRNASNLIEKLRYGPVFYVLGILVTYTQDGIFKDHWEVLSFFAIVIIGIVVLRSLKISYAPEANLRLGQVLTFSKCLFLMNAAAWGLCFAYVEFLSGYPKVSLFMIICTVTYSTAAANNASIDKNLALFSLILYYLPPVIALALFGPEPFGTCFVLVGYSFYLVTAVNNNHKEYVGRLEVECQLQENRAELRKLSNSDGLTGLANRRHFQNVFSSLFHSSLRQEVDFSVVLLDLDHFKVVNDTHGHVFGDSCLVHVATQLKKVFLRQSDFVARIGGEEFIVLLPGTSVQESQDLALSFLRVLNQTPCVADGKSVVVTASIGVGALNLESDKSDKDLFKRVDDLCYKAKSKGRNRVCNVNECVV